MVTIDGKQLVLSETFVVIDNQAVTIEGTVKNDRIVIELTFHAGDEGKSGEARWRFENGVLRMDFLGWRSPLGTVLKRPTRLGKVDDQDFGFQIAHKLIGDANLVHFQLFLGGVYE